MPVHWGTLNNKCPPGSPAPGSPAVQPPSPPRKDLEVPSFEEVKYEPASQMVRSASFSGSVDSAYFSESDGESDCETLCGSGSDYDDEGLENDLLESDCLDSDSLDSDSLAGDSLESESLMSDILDSDSLDSDCPEDASDSEVLSEPPLVHDHVEELICYHLLNLIDLFLSKSQIPSLRCSKLLISEPVLIQVGRELLRASSSEPCGLKGALIDLFVENGKDVHDIGQLTADPLGVPTFKLNLVLRLEPGLWPKIQGLFSTPPSIAPGFGLALKLGPQFQVLKKKLYITPPLEAES